MQPADWLDTRITSAFLIFWQKKIHFPEKKWATLEKFDINSIQRPNPIKFTSKTLSRVLIRLRYSDKLKFTSHVTSVCNHRTESRDQRSNSKIFFFFFFCSVDVPRWRPEYGRSPFAPGYTLGLVGFLEDFLLFQFCQ